MALSGVLWHGKTQWSVCPGTRWRDPPPLQPCLAHPEEPPGCLADGQMGSWFAVFGPPAGLHRSRVGAGGGTRPFSILQSLWLQYFGTENPVPAWPGVLSPHASSSFQLLGNLGAQGNPAGGGWEQGQREDGSSPSVKGALPSMQLYLARLFLPF